MPSMIRTRKQEMSGRSVVIRSVLCTAGVGILIEAATLSAAAAVCLHYNISGVLLAVCAYAACAAASLLTGMIAGKMMRKSGMLYGAACAALTCILPLLLCVILHKSVGAGFALAALLHVLCGAIGGIVSVNMRRRRKYR